jgi:hypothetical protein
VYEITLEAVERGGLRWTRPLATRTLQVVALADAAESRPPAGDWGIVYELDPGSPKLHERLRRLPGRGLPTVPVPTIPLPAMPLPSLSRARVPLPPLPRLPEMTGLPEVPIPNVSAMVPRLSGLLATGHSLAGIDLFWWIDCTPLSGFTGDPHFDRAGHVGMHERIQAAVLRHRAFEGVLAKLKQAAGHIADGKRLAIVFWCNAGEHRSVACAESFARWLGVKYPAEHVVRHFCADQWTRRGCGGWSCPSCREHSEVRVAVGQQWSAIMEA